MRTGRTGTKEEEKNFINRHKQCIRITSKAKAVGTGAHRNRTTKLKTLFGWLVGWHRIRIFDNISSCFHFLLAFLPLFFSHFQFQYFSIHSSKTFLCRLLFREHVPFYFISYTAVDIPSIILVRIIPYSTVQRTKNTNNKVVNHSKNSLKCGKQIFRSMKEVLFIHFDNNRI